MDQAIEEFFLRRSLHIEEERKLFANFTKLVAPSEKELLSLQWDERFGDCRYLNPDSCVL
jgi:hypothetical protein